MGQLDFGVIGNCQCSAVIDHQGRYLWSSLPRFDSPAVFAALLGTEENGLWDCLPDGVPFETRQTYARNTNVLCTEVHLQNGDRYDIIDFAPRFWKWEGYYRPAQFIRILRRVKGTPRVKFRLRPRFDYGRVKAEVQNSNLGLTYQCPRGEVPGRLTLNTDIPASYVMAESPFNLQQDHYAVLTYDDHFVSPLKFRCEEFLERTLDYWRTWVSHCKIPAEYQDAVIRSALVLKLHIFEDTGAIIAATTTSLPESLEGGRCWDYRYCWLRDAYFVVNALLQLGHTEEMQSFINYLQNLATTGDNRKLQPVYGIGGELKLEEREIPWLRGFQGVTPVRVGNHAYTHHQHDVYGEMVLAMAPLFFDRRLPEEPAQRAFQTVKDLVEHSERIFDERDAGIWEFRSESRHYLFSKLLCWAAVDRGLKIAQELGDHALVSRWAPARDRMRQVIEEQGWNETLGIYTQALGSASADASNLLMNHINFHRGNDPRYRRMVENYRELLTVNGYVFRYKNPDDFGVPKNAFTICNFWMIDALASIGQTREGRELFESLLRNRNHLGLLSEDIDPKTGELWGNFPQTYSHVGLINSAIGLSKDWDEVF